MTPEVKAAITYFMLCFIASCGMIIHGYNLKKNKVTLPTEDSGDKAQIGQLLIVIGVLTLVWQAYELYLKLI
ncbi:hypothetical protein [Thalassotalea mangrovi]|uniref:Uncharacterized protein n=1 Tax=Thalassotalea mangrovi TaxID=2572245 RepID=A0A4U1B310_9GAMM|nr:hypothetical protein [Thalassotalea mangrovi]TKB44102.1 hypothetical protein E8M12_12895 [Thalassotalea mangrovi]